MKTKHLATDAVLAAMCTVLALVSIKVGNNLKVTFESVPVLMAGLMFGPLNGLAVGGIGSFIYQIMSHGITATTLLWILPYLVCGLVSGLYANKVNFQPGRLSLSLTVFACEILIFIINSAAIYIDGHVYGWYNPVTFISMLPARAIICVVKSLLFSAFLPGLIRSVKKGLHL